MTKNRIYTIFVIVLFFYLPLWAEVKLVYSTDSDLTEFVAKSIFSEFETAHEAGTVDGELVLTPVRNTGVDDLVEGLKKADEARILVVSPHFESDAPIAKWFDPEIFKTANFAYELMSVEIPGLAQSSEVGSRALLDTLRTHNPPGLGDNVSVFAAVITPPAMLVYKANNSDDWFINKNGRVGHLYYYGYGRSSKAQLDIVFGIDAVDHYGDTVNYILDQAEREAYQALLFPPQYLFHLSYFVQNTNYKKAFDVPMGSRPVVVLANQQALSELKLGEVDFHFGIKATQAIAIHWDLVYNRYRSRFILGGGEFATPQPISDRVNNSLDSYTESSEFVRLYRQALTN